MKKLTVMIPTYNQSQYIEQAIESALSIKYDNLEIIIADDCSTDNTESVVKKYLDNESITYYKNEKNLGMIGNYQYTLYNRVTGDYVVNLDGDDFFEKSDFFMEAIKLLDNNADMSCVLGDRQNYDDVTGQIKLVSNATNPSLKMIMDGNDFFINMQNIGFNFSHFASLYRRDIALKIGFYDKDILSADSESINRLYLNHKVGYLPIVVGNWRTHPLNASHKYISAKLKNIQKYDYLLEYASDKKIFDLDTLNEWRLNNQSGTLAQDVLYYLKRKHIYSAMTLIKESFYKDSKLGRYVVLKLLQRGFKKIL